MWRANSLEKTLILGKIEGKRRGWQRMNAWVASPTQWTWVWANPRRQWRTEEPGVLQSMGLQSWTWLQLNRNNINIKRESLFHYCLSHFKYAILFILKALQVFHSKPHTYYWMWCLPLITRGFLKWLNVVISPNSWRPICSAWKVRTQNQAWESDSLWVASWRCHLDSELCDLKLLT